MALKTSSTWQSQVELVDFFLHFSPLIILLSCIRLVSHEPDFSSFLLLKKFLRVINWAAFAHSGWCFIFWSPGTTCLYSRPRLLGWILGVVQKALVTCFLEKSWQESPSERHLYLEITYVQGTVSSSVCLQFGACLGE